MSDGGEVDAGCVQTLLRRMVDSLVAGGDLRSPEWRDAFGRVPRHLFIPVIYRQLPQAGRYERIDGSRPERAEEWLRLVYSDDTHTVQINGDSQGSPDPGRAAGDIVEGTATSSSTMPSLMALMLEALDVTDDSAVLEIGTGTGYNTALLCERLGAPNVTSIDVDAALVDAARARLAALGHAPTLAVRDGEDGYPANAPYDRILATCSVTHVPRAWVTQCRPGGVIVTSLYRELGGGPLARLTVHDDGTASGRFLPTYAGFMPVRAHPAADLVDMLGAVPDDAGTSRSTTINGTVLDDPDFVFFAAHLLPDAGRLQAADDTGWRSWLLAPDGSWASEATDDQRPTAVQGGSRRLWDALEDAYLQWTALGCPPRERFGLTVIPDKRHSLWLDTPGSDHVWHLPET